MVAPIRNRVRSRSTFTRSYRWRTESDGTVVVVEPRARDEQSYVVHFPAFGKGTDRALGDMYLIVQGDDLALTSCPMTATKFISAKEARSALEQLPPFVRSGPLGCVKELVLVEHPHNYSLYPVRTATR